MNKRQPLTIKGCLLLLILLPITMAYSQSFLFTVDMGQDERKQYASSGIKILFGGGSMLITQNDQTDAVLMKDIKKMFFTEGTLAVKKLRTGTKIFFNPTTNLLSFDIPTAESVTIRIFNIVGHAILKTQQQGNASIDISSIQSGIYIVQVNDECLKFIKP